MQLGVYLINIYSVDFVIFPGFFREVIPGATCPLNVMALNLLDTTMQRNQVLTPGVDQQYSAYFRRIMPINRHHAIFNYLDTCLPAVENETLNPGLYAMDYAILGHTVLFKHILKSNFKKILHFDEYR